MSLWGNKDLVASTGTIAINFDTKTVTGSATTFSTSEVSSGDVIVVGAGATYGYAIVDSVASNTSLTIYSTEQFVSGLTTVPAGTAYFVSQKPISSVYDSVYRAPQSKTSGFSTSPVFTDVFGVDVAETAAAAAATVGGKDGAYSVAHAGWVGVTTYTDMHGNLRVKSETLVAGSMITSDAADDSRFPDS